MMIASIFRVALAAGVLVLTACATPPGASPSTGRDIPTQSDQTDADRRARVRLELASAYFARGQNTTALDEVKLALAAKPDLPEAYNLRGLIYAALGDNATAEDSYRRALQMSPRDGDTLHNYGWLLCQMQRYPDADERFRSALAIPNYRNASRTLMAQGICQARSGRWDLAETTLARSYELDPSNPVTAINFAEVLYRREQYERARFYVRRVNKQDELVSAQTLWLAARIEKKLGNRAGVEEFGKELKLRFPQSREVAAFERGQFDE